MNFGSYFRLTSYATITAAALALFVAGGIGPALIIAWAVVMLLAWKFEGTRWQLSERVALIIILASLPVFYLDWRMLTPFLEVHYLQTGQRGNAEVSVLAHLILFLSAIKLLQRKADRDWFFLCLISFFEILLAAGLTASPLFLATLIAYLLCAISTIVAFEIQKARRKVTALQTRLLVPPDSALFRKLPMRLWRRRYLETRRLPIVSAGLLLLIVLLALPFFLIAPRTASSALRRGGNGVSGFIGFSDNVTLGQVGQLKGSDEIFMHVRLQNSGPVNAANLRWRGVALDNFTGKAWRKTMGAERFDERKSESGFFQLGTAETRAHLMEQTFIVEPVDTPVLFGAPRVVGLRARLPFIRVDSEGAIQTRPHDQERLVYTVISDTSEPRADALRSDPLTYTHESARYRETPAQLDPRIGALARVVVEKYGAQNGYDKARAIESYLRDSYGYTLDLKATGPDPLADFLFNIRAGHCEYFATAMAVMLRTQGVASRVVNGFLPGEYNETAGAFTVRQSDAHSWVEAYFPQTNSWVTFDPTPPAGRTSHVRGGLAGQLSKLSEALDLLWFQYVVGYDKQEQRSLVTSIRRQFLNFEQDSIARINASLLSLPGSLIWMLAVGLIAVALALIFFLARRVRNLGWRRGLKVWRVDENEQFITVDFYQRLVRLFEKQGIKRELYQTPLEFAATLGATEAHLITNAYNRVRYGAEELSDSDMKQIDSLLRRIEQRRKET